MEESHGRRDVNGNFLLPPLVKVWVLVFWPNGKRDHMYDEVENMLISVPGIW
jgi:hypothetical protein